MQPLNKLNYFHTMNIFSQSKKYVYYMKKIPEIFLQIKKKIVNIFQKKKEKWFSSLDKGNCHYDIDTGTLTITSTLETFQFLRKWRKSSRTVSSVLNSGVCSRFQS